MLGLEAMEEQVLEDKRICVNCNSTSTYVNKKGEMQWYKNGTLCKKCYNKISLNPIHHPITNPRRISFKGKLISLKFNPRRGVCYNCGSIKGIDCKRTNLHHEKYHPNDILKDTVELCSACHIAKTIELGQIDFNKRFNK